MLEPEICGELLDTKICLKYQEMVDYVIVQINLFCIFLAPNEASSQNE